MSSDTWVKQPKYYMGQSFFGSPFCGVKLVDTKTGKYTYHIAQQTNGMANPNTLQQIPSGSYPAIMQFMDILDNCPTILKKGDFKLTAKGQLPKALLDLLGTDKISKVTKGKVRTLAEIKETMNSWSAKQGKAKSTYRRK